jgi:hypothetical protein
MFIDEATSGGLFWGFENPSGREYMYGTAFNLQFLTGGSWEPVTPANNLNFSDIGLIIAPYSTVKESVDWRSIYGELPNGTYKFIKAPIYLRAPGDFDEFVLEGIFTISDTSRVMSQDGTFIYGDPPPQSVPAPATPVQSSAVKMSVRNAYPGGIAYMFDNPTDEEYLYRSKFDLHTLVGNRWEAVPPITDTIYSVWSFTDEHNIIAPRSETERMMELFQNYGELPATTYKLTRTIYPRQSNTEYVLEAVFTLSAPTAPEPLIIPPRTGLFTIEEWEGPSADELELIFEDHDNRYYLSSIRSHLIMITATENGSRFSLSDAISLGVGIDDLIAHGLEVIVQPKQ